MEELIGKSFFAYCNDMFKIIWFIIIGR